MQSIRRQLGIDPYIIGSENFSLCNPTKTSHCKICGLCYSISKFTPGSFVAALHAFGIHAKDNLRAGLQGMSDLGDSSRCPFQAIGSFAFSPSSFRYSSSQVEQSCSSPPPLRCTSDSMGHWMASFRHSRTLGEDSHYAQAGNPFRRHRPHPVVGILIIRLHGRNLISEPAIEIIGQSSSRHLGH